jgi:predicted Zn-ribbon and HTH transcriptional regulator
VAAEEAEHADAVLNQIHGVAHAEYVRPSDADDAVPPSRCERCGSPEVRRVQKLAMFGVLALLITAVFIAVDQAMWIFYSVIAAGIFTLLAARWQCRNCGYRW